MRRTSLVVVAALGLVIVAQAGAHAELTPKSVPAGSVSTFTLSVEGEKSAPTVKVAMRLPSGMANLKPADVSGWQVKLGGRVITWTGGRIAQGKTGEFPIAGQFPRTPGKTLKFPVVQTYRGGEVVRWIGAPSSAEPAPTIRLTAAATPPPAPEPPGATTPTTPTAPTTSASENGDDDNGSAGWIIGAAIVVGLVAAGAALLWRRRS
jgi:uncharacterized protein YcnI